jgi:four helix bundle protein
MKEELQQRTKQYALRMMKLVAALPRTQPGRVIGNQLIRSATSVGANYRAACRARSRAEFAAKLGVVVEEADESGYWLELISAGGLLATNSVQPLLEETNELVAIFVLTRKSVQRTTS